MAAWKTSTSTKGPAQQFVLKYSVAPKFVGRISSQLCMNMHWHQTSSDGTVVFLQVVVICSTSAVQAL